MKITIVIGPFQPVPPVLGGAIERTMHELSIAFAHRGHEVSVISRRYPDFPDRENLQGVNHVRVQSSDRPKSFVRALLRDLVYSVRVLFHLPDADAIITNSFMLPIVIRRRRYGALCLSVGRMPKGQHRLYGHASCLIADSHALATQLKKSMPRMAHKVYVIPRPLLARYSKRVRDGLSGTREKTILYVGRVHPEKGVALLVEAFVRLPQSNRNEWKLVIVGPWEVAQGGGGEAYLSELRCLSAECAERVDFVGPVFDQDELFAYYVGAEIFVYPSLAERGETFGVAAMEAMAIGCCTVVSRLDCFSDFIVDGRTGLVFDHASDGAAENLAACLGRLMNDETLRNELRTGGIEKGAEFHLPNVMYQYEELFGKIADTE